MLTFSFAAIYFQASFTSKCVSSVSGISSYLIQLAEHPAGVAEDADFRALDVVPADRNFLKPQAVMLSDEQKLDVETEPVDLSSSRAAAGTCHIESFKAALRVGERQPGHRSDDEVHNLAALLAPPGLMRADQAAVESTRAERDVEIACCDRIDQVLAFLRSASKGRRR